MKLAHVRIIPGKWRPRVTSAAEDKSFQFTGLKIHKVTAPQIRRQINANRAILADTSLQENQTFVLKQLLRNHDKGKATTRRELFWPRNRRNVNGPVEIWALVWLFQIWDLWFQPSCICVCIFSKWKANWTNMTTTAVTDHPWPQTPVCFYIGLHHMTWPPQSPHLNPMEMVLMRWTTE